MIVKSSVLDAAKNTRAAVIGGTRNLDDYSAGFCNGIEFVLAEIEKRSPDYIFSYAEKEERAKQIEVLKNQRTVGGVISKK